MKAASANHDGPLARCHQARQRERHPVTSTDFFPTIMEMAGLKPQLPLPIDGVSFTTALRGKPQDRGALYWHYPHYGNQGNAPTAAVREGDWKLIEWHEDGRLELPNRPTISARKPTSPRNIPTR